MKNILFACIIVPVGICITGYQATWWLSAAWTVGILAFLHIGIKKSILIGAVAFGLVWLVISLYWLRIDETDMMGRTSTLLGGISSSALLFVTFLVGLITGGLSGWLGGVLGELSKNKNTTQQNG